MNNNQILKKYHLTEEEYTKIKKDLNKKEEEITELELNIYSALWSEHCSYKSSKNLLKRLPTKSENVIQGPGENAGIISIDENLALVSKIESHNHPSAVDPFNGAATGVGGIIRDIIAMGGRPIALMNSLRFGFPSNKKNQSLLEGVVKGIAHYGNCIGIPTIGGEIKFEETYDQQAIVNVMCLGIVKKNKILKAFIPHEDNLIFYVGSKTGIDGLGGAQFSSDQLDSSHLLKNTNTSSMIQIGDPFIGKILIETCLKLVKKGLVLGMQDMGASGLSGAASEMAYKSNKGIRIDIEKIPSRIEGLSPSELMLSESQERMLIVIDKKNQIEVIDILKKWELDFSEVGKVLKNPDLEVYKNNHLLAKIPLESLCNGAPLKSYDFIPEKKSVLVEDTIQKEYKVFFNKKQDWSELVLDFLNHQPFLIDKRKIYEQFDYLIGTNTILNPEDSGASGLRIKKYPVKILSSLDGNSRYVYLNPKQGTFIAVAESFRNIISAGGSVISITNGLNLGSPKDEIVQYQLYEIITGMEEICHFFKIPVISGNISLNNKTSNGNNIYPTPIIGAIGINKNNTPIITSHFKNIGDVIFLIGETKNEIHGSSYLKVFNPKLVYQCPYFNMRIEKTIQEIIQNLIQLNLVESATDISEGGLIISLIRSCLNTQFGIHLREKDSTLSDSAFLFGESQSRFLISIKSIHESKVISFLEKGNIKFQKLGIVSNKKDIKIDSLLHLKKYAIKNEG